MSGQRAQRRLSDQLISATGSSIRNLLQGQGVIAPAGGRSIIIGDISVSSGMCEASDFPDQPYSKNARQIGVKYRVTNVKNLDTKTEEMTLMFRIFLCWKPLCDEVEEYETKVGRLGLVGEEVVAADIYQPHLRFLNAKETSSLFQKLTWRSEQRLAYLETLWLGTFTQAFNMAHFPFDRQVVSIDAALSANVEKEVLIDYDEVTGLPEQKDAFRPHPIIGNFEAVTDRIVLWTLARTEEKEQKVNSGSFAKLSVEIMFERNPTHTLWGVYFILFILMFMSGSSLLHSMSISDRINILLTVVLTVAAYKYVIYDELPHKPYLTFTDMYILAAFAFLCFVLTALSLAHQCLPEWADPMVRGLLGLCYLVFCVVHAIGVLVWIQQPSVFYRPWPLCRSLSSVYTKPNQPWDQEGVSVKGNKVKKTD